MLALHQISTRKRRPRTKYQPGNVSLAPNISQEILASQPRTKYQPGNFGLKIIARKCLPPSLTFGHTFFFSFQRDLAFMPLSLGFSLPTSSFTMLNFFLLHLLFHSRPHKFPPYFYYHYWFLNISVYHISLHHPL